MESITTTQMIAAIAFLRLFMIRSLNSFIPAGLWLVVLLSLTLYKLDKLAPQIREQINARVEKEED